MRKLLLACLASLSLSALTACGPSAFEIKEMSSECEFNVEIRYVQDDSVALFVGNALYVATSQLVSGKIYPLSVSTRDPMNIDGRAPTDVVNSDGELKAYIDRRVPGASHFGIILGDNVKNEIGFDPEASVKVFKEFFQSSYPGSTAVLFGEKGGDLVSAQKLY